MPGTPERPAAAVTVLAFDYGRRRIGCAIGQPVTASASPLGTASNGESGPDWPRIDAWIGEWEPTALVVGLPRNADGSDSSVTRSVREFAHDLERYALPVHCVDERYSSIEAEDHLRRARARGRRGRISKADVDAAAAVVIAERWLGENS